MPCIPRGRLGCPAGGTGAPAVGTGNDLVPLEASVGSCEEEDSGVLPPRGATPHNPTRECFVLQQYDDTIHSAHNGESSTGGEPTSPNVSADERPQQGGDAHEWRCACLDELDETQMALEEEHAKLHYKLGVDIAPTPAHERAQ